MADNKDEARNILGGCSAGDALCLTFLPRQLLGEPFGFLRVLCVRVSARITLQAHWEYDFNV